MSNEEIKKSIENRENTHYGIYSDIGNVLEKIDTTDLCRYFVEVTMNGNDSCLRNYIEQQIIASEINKLRYENK